MNDNNQINESESIKKLLEDNLKLNQEIYKNTKYIKSYVFWAQIAAVLKIIIIVVPIILAIIYLPPLLSGLLGQYQDLLGGTDASGAMANPLNSLLQGSPAQVKSLLK